jgi:hypothetical protein
MSRPKEIRGGRADDYWSVGVAHLPGAFEQGPFEVRLRYGETWTLRGVTRRQVERLRDICNEALKAERGY